MTTYRVLLRCAAMALPLALSLQSAALADDPYLQEIKPDKGLSLDVGSKHTMSYFEPQDGGCGLTTLIAAKDGGVTGDTPGTRISVTLKKGTAMVIDVNDLHSAEFQCAPEGDHMHARLFVREGHPKGKKS